MLSLLLHTLLYIPKYQSIQHVLHVFLRCPPLYAYDFKKVPRSRTCSSLCSAPGSTALRLQNPPKACIYFLSFSILRTVFSRNFKTHRRILRFSPRSSIDRIHLKTLLRYMSLPPLVFDDTEFKKQAASRDACLVQKLTELHDVWRLAVLSHRGCLKHPKIGKEIGHVFILSKKTLRQGHVWRLAWSRRGDTKS
jgi:hypothetical protein